MNRQRLVATFLRLTQVDSPSHAEAALAQLLTREFAERDWQVRTDSSGNVIASLACDSQQPPLLFASHMEVVMPCLRMRLQVTDGVIHSLGEAAASRHSRRSTTLPSADSAGPGRYRCGPRSVRRSTWPSSDSGQATAPYN